MKKIIKIVLSSISVILVALTLILIIANVSAMRKEKPVSVFGYSFSYVPTESMKPVINPNDVVIFKKCQYNNLDVGDIIVYRSKTGNTAGIYIIHRIKEITNEGFVMLGDNNNGAVDPELVTKDMLVGKFVKVFNAFNIGKIASNKNVIFFILVIIVMVIIVMEILNIYTTFQKDKIKAVEEKRKQELLDEIRQELLEEIKNEKEKAKD